jgi:hypothetical protein
MGRDQQQTQRLLVQTRTVLYGLLQQHNQMKYVLSRAEIYTF